MKKDYGSKKKKRRAEYLKRQQVKANKFLRMQDLRNAGSIKEFIKILNKP